MRTYRAGTLTLTANSDVITGVGTAFVANVSIGDIIICENGQVFEALAIPDDTHLKVDVAAKAAGSFKYGALRFVTAVNFRDLSLKIEQFLSDRQSNLTQFSDWMTGSRTGGPNGDGKYPMTDRYGTTKLFMCPELIAYGYQDSLNQAAAAKVSADAAKASETNANTSKNAAATSATAAKTSETNSKTSETNAKTSETNSKTSENAAATSKNAAATSATNAATSETNANSSKNAAANSATAAGTSATNASTSETNASNSKTAAANSATAASTSASAASTSAGAAKTSETNAKTSETNSKTSETNAANSATAANSSKLAAAQSETNAGNSASAASNSKTAAQNSADAAAASAAAASSANMGGIDKAPDNWVANPFFATSGSMPAPTSSSAAFKVLQSSDSAVPANAPSARVGAFSRSSAVAAFLNFALSNPDAFIPTAAGEKLDASAWLNVTGNVTGTNPSASLFATEYTASGTAIRQVRIASYDNVLGGWQRVTGTLTTSSTCARVQFQLVAETILPAAGVIYSAEPYISKRYGLPVQSSMYDQTVSALLQVGAFGLGSTDLIDTVGSYNDQRATGFYMMGGSATEGPTTGACKLIVMTNATRYIQQLAFPQSRNVMYQRSSDNDVWQPWTKIATYNEAANALVGWGLTGAAAADVSPTALLPDVNLNTVLLSGTYGNSQNARAKLTLNYPIAKAGSLLVQNGGSQITTQIYQEYDSGRIWNRSRYNDTWSNWSMNWDTDTLVKTDSALDTTAGRMLKVGDYGLGNLNGIKVTFTANADWAKPAGWTGFIDVAATKAAGIAVPVVLLNGTSPSYGIWSVTGRRDTSGGYVGMFIDYANGRTWIGHASVSTDAPQFKEVFSQSNVSAVIQQLMDDADVTAAQNTLAIPALISGMTQGITTKSIAGGSNVTLTAAEANVGVLWFTGALTANISVIVPAAQQEWVVYNMTSGNFTLTIKTASGVGQQVAQGRSSQLVCGGLNMYFGQSGFNDAHFAGEVTTRNINAIRMINQNSSYAAIWRADPGALYLLLTNLNDPTGNFNNLRPMTVNLANGEVSFSQGAFTIAPPAGDGSLRIPTAGWVQSELATSAREYAGYGYGITASLTLSAAHFGFWLQLAANDMVVTLPNVATISPGRSVLLRSGMSNQGFTVNTSNGNTLNVTSGIATTSYTFSQGEVVEITSNGTNWYVTARSKLGEVAAAGVNSDITGLNALTDAAKAAIALPGRNRIINGDMAVAQRNANAAMTNTMGKYGFFDRWQASKVGGGGGFTLMGDLSFVDTTGRARSALMARITTSATQTALNGSAYWIPMLQFLEGWNVVDLMGKKTTLSFTFSASVVGKYTVSVRTGPTATKSFLTNIEVTAANTAKRYEINLPPMPLDAGIQNTNNVGIAISVGAMANGDFKTTSTDAWIAGNYLMAEGAVFWCATTNATTKLTDVQFEEGGAATPFERLSWGTTFQLCLRYFEQCPGTVSSNQQRYKWHYYAVPKRAVPTLTVAGGSLGGGSVDVTSANGFRMGTAPGSDADFTIFADAEL